MASTSSILQEIKVNNSKIWKCSTFKYTQSVGEERNHSNTSEGTHPNYSKSENEKKKPEIAENTPESSLYGYLCYIPMYTKTVTYKIANTGVSVGKYIWKTAPVEDGKKLCGSVYNDITKCKPGTETLETGALVIKDWGGGKALGSVIGGFVGVNLLPGIGGYYGTAIGAVIGGALESGRGMEHVVDEVLPKKKKNHESKP